MERNWCEDKGGFESRGWLFQHSYNNIGYYRKGDIWLDDGRGAFLDVECGSKVSIITTDAGYNVDGPNHSIKFSGFCESFEEFDRLCEMIVLKA